MKEIIHDVRMMEKEGYLVMKKEEHLCLSLMIL